MATKDLALKPAPLTVTPLTTLRRRPARGRHDRATVHAIVDEALCCHVAVTVGDQPCALPTAHVRVGDRVYVHGARANRIFSVLASGAPACVTVTILDGLVFGRSWFHHSMNYRCAMLYGRGAEVTDPDEKLAALTAIVDKAAPGRSREARRPSAEELASTLVVRFPIDEASAKVRSGPPIDGPDESAEDCWAGVLPLVTAPLAPTDDPNLRAGIPFSAAVGAQARRLGGSSQRDTPYERVRGTHRVSTDPALVDFDFVHRFLAEESYWARDVGRADQEMAIAHSLSFGLYDGATQIGFARVLTDYGRVAYLADVFVVSSARGAGLGTWLVGSVLEHPALARVERWLLGTADAHGLYERFGFVRAAPGRYMVRRVGA